MRVNIDLNATTEYCANRDGCCVFLDREHAKCNLFKENLYYDRSDKAPVGTLIQRCWACTSTFVEEDEK